MSRSKFTPMKFRSFNLTLWHLGKRKLVQRHRSLKRFTEDDVREEMDVLREAGYLYFFERPYVAGTGVPKVFDLWQEHGRAFLDEWTVFLFRRDMRYIFKNQDDAIWLQLVMDDEPNLDYIGCR